MINGWRLAKICQVEKQHVAFSCENKVMKVMVEQVVFIKEKVEILHGSD